MSAGKEGKCRREKKGLVIMDLPRVRGH